MTYDPNIPASGDILSQSQQDIQDNFSVLNTKYGLDHWSFDNDPSAYQGYHKFLSFPFAQASNPSLGAALGVFFPKVDPKDTSGTPRTQLYYRNPTETYQITNRFYSQASGYYMLPLGQTARESLIIMWGRVTTSTANTGVTFNQIANYDYPGPHTAGFPNNLFNVQISPIIQDANTLNSKGWSIAYSTPAPSVTGFNILYSGGDVANLDFFWIAIGN